MQTMNHKQYYLHAILKPEQSIFIDRKKFYFNNNLLKYKQDCFISCSTINCCTIMIIVNCVKGIGTWFSDTTIFLQGGMYFHDFVQNNRFLYSFMKAGTQYDGNGLNCLTCSTIIVKYLKMSEKTTPYTFPGFSLLPKYRYMFGHRGI